MSQLTKAEGNENIRVTQSIQMMATQSFSVSVSHLPMCQFFVYLHDKTNYV